MEKKLSIGYSPCPNDTFIFYAMMHGISNLFGLEFSTPRLEDVETLNSLALEKRLDITKLSFHAAAYALDDYAILSSGSALGRGCGPLLVSRVKLDLNNAKHYSIAIPGKLTTATMLFRMFMPECINFVEMRFDKIMSAISDGIVDAGVIIHESRFTYRDYGLFCLQDLGEWWEETTGHPIPLGCIAAKRSLGEERIKKIDKAIRNSIDWAMANRSATLPYILGNAQEIDKGIVDNHISLYVNEFSRDIAREGKEAVIAFLTRGREAGILPESEKLPFG